MKKLLLAALWLPLLAFAQSYPSPTFNNVTIDGTLSVTGAPTFTSPVSTSSGGLGANNGTATGVPVFSAGTATVTATPALGTPSAITLTNGTALPLGGLAAQAANTVVANVTGSSASPTAFVMPSCNGGSIQWANGTGFACAQKLLYAVRDITGVTTTDTASSTDALINWLSTSSSNKTENLPACSSANNGQAYIIKDGAGTSFTYPIAITPASGTIEGTNTFSASNNKGAWTVVCDGTNTNWMVN